MRARLVDRIRKENPLYRDADIRSLDQTIKYCDKSTFSDMQKKNLSFPQFKNKVWQKRADVHYTCFDDIKSELYDCSEEKSKKQANLNKLIEKYVPKDKLQAIQDYEHRHRFDKFAGGDSGVNSPEKLKGGNKSMENNAFDTVDASDFNSPKTRKKEPRPGITGDDKPFSFRCFRSIYMPPP